jgi:hypothetical protein
MRKLIVVLIAGLTMLSFAGPSFAQAKMAGQPTRGKMAELAKAEAPQTASPHRLIGEVAAVDQAAKTMKIKFMVRNNPREATFTVAGQAAPTLAELKPGERVWVGYQKEQGRLVAQSIAEAHPKASK